MGIKLKFNTTLKRSSSFYLHVKAYDIANIYFFIFLFEFVEAVKVEEHDEELEQPESDTDSYLGKLIQPLSQGLTSFLPG